MSKLKQEGIVAREALFLAAELGRNAMSKLIAVQDSKLGDGGVALHFETEEAEPRRFKVHVYKAQGSRSTLAHVLMPGAELAPRKSRTTGGYEVLGSGKSWTQLPYARDCTALPHHVMRGAIWEALDGSRGTLPGARQ